MELLKKLEELYPDSSKTTLRKWIAQGRVLPDGSLLPRKKYARCGIEILYEDKEIIVIEKPAGLLSVATPLDRRSAHDILKQRYYRAQVFPVHRLDKETSGVLVFAYTPRARDALKEQFEKHDIDREYEAIVIGNITPPNGTWKSHLFEGKNFYVMSGKHGKLAVTHYQTILSSNDLSLIRIRLETGRKNQIRVQSSDAGHPVLGDQKYGYRGPKLKRLYLHARKLGIKHPVTKKEIEFLSSVSIAEEFKRLDKLLVNEGTKKPS
jgi:23S rRNA pseudouridine1911/1915/1917 synthase